MAAADRPGFTRRKFLVGAAVGAGTAAGDLAAFTTLAAAATNPIATENALAGTDADWNPQVLDSSIEGFATEYSVNAGDTIGFKIRTASTNYRILVYRLGWYQGKGARRVANLRPSVTLPQTQPNPSVDSVTGLVDCSNWAVSASWQVPTSAVSGIYVANFERLDSQGGRNRALFVVRNDGRISDILVKTSDTTYQAYNTWGGNSLYGGSAYWGRATKVSYNRPSSIDELENDFFYGEHPLVRWLERNGFDVSYCGSVDIERKPTELTKHKVFVSSGHDEYWSGAMRASVEAARDAGVNIVFMSGNEVFWRIRWEPDSAGTPYKTLVCYKETLANAKIDPSPEWTGTWRDKRFSPPSNGGNPENALTGTLFRAINPLDSADFALSVPSQYKSLRIWRNTNIATLAAGQSATLSPATIGYEWDTDVDNGVRPAGLIRMSETTNVAAQVLQDEGATYIQAPLTHYLAMYRAPSGALVWGTGTVQWAWGLDDYHTNRPDVPVPTDVRMQQATLNVLADMGSQPATRQSDLVAATKSTDAIAPVSVISAPADGASVAVGTVVTITGTAVDSGGGVVAGVEVSVDGGQTWHPATGTSTWSYAFMPMTVGSRTLRSRAVDDSCNLETPSPGRTLIGTQRAMPCSIWDNTAVPVVAAANDATRLELGVKFRTNLNGFVKGIRFYKGQGNLGQHVGKLYRNDGTLLASAIFVNETSTGWQTVQFAAPVPVAAGVTHVASYLAPSGRYGADVGYFATARQFDPLRALASGEDGPNGVYAVGGGFPRQTYGSTNYWVDIVFDTDDGLNPSVVDLSPASGVGSVDASTVVAATFSEWVDPTKILFQLAAQGGANVAGTTSYDATTRTARFTPSAPLAAPVTYTATVSGAVDGAGNPMAGPVSWSFTTAGLPGSVPTSIWTSATVPAVASINDPNAIEVGLRFTSSIDGLVTALRFYKGPANSGSHVGHLWTLAGSLLGTVTFAQESSQGWQQANFAQPIAISKNQIYVASYHLTNGGYSADAGGFATSGVTRGPLRALSAGEAGANGVFAYGAGGFPTSSWGNANYWVDLVFTTPPDLSPPVVANVVPAPALQAVGPGEPIVVTFDEPVDPASLNLTLSASGGGVVASTLAWINPSTASLTPNAPLAAGAKYDASVLATDLVGNRMRAPFVWSFTTAVAAGLTPATLWDTSTRPATDSVNDNGAVEVGVKFRSDIDGSIVAIRFYKGPGNTGAHTGRIWAANATLLGSVLVTGETATGWQQANFGSPIPIQAGLTYVASYFAPAGHYSATSGGLSTAVDRAPLHAMASAAVGGNGVYSYGTGSFPNQTSGSANYFVDVVFADVAAPRVVNTSPASGAINVDSATDIVIGFSEPIAAGSAQVELRDSAGALVSVGLLQAPGSATVTARPSAALAGGTSYTVSVLAAKDLAGNALAAPVSWAFTTIDPRLFSLFGAAVPATAASGDSSLIEVGTKFRVTQPCALTSIRFYKGPGNTGTHVGTLWTASGQQLAQVTFTGESAGGWQSIALPAAVTLTVGTTYVVSYLAPVGQYSVNGGFFNAGPFTNGPIVGNANVAGDPNGVFAYGGGFPTGSFNGSNYWVDVIVRTSGV